MNAIGTRGFHERNLIAAKSPIVLKCILLAALLFNLS
jgi:hypothetical protein